MPNASLRLAASALLVLPAACGGGAERPAAAKRVILVTCDTLRADHLSCYGYPLPTTPNVDAFAREAALYDNAWTCSSLTGPALSTLLSGRMPDEIGVSGGNRMMMRPEVTTFPELLAKAGIATAAVVSNWVLARPPAELGDAGVSQGFQTFDDRMTTPELNRPFAERRAKETTAAAIAWLESRPKIAEEPFFLWVHYQDPHGPYTPAEALAELYLQPVEGREPELPLGKDQRGRGEIPAYQALGQERRPSRYRARYDGEINEFDTGFGQLIAWLREHRLLDDALVVFTADHGESLGEHDRWFCHGQNLHVEETRIPFLVRFPGGAARGERRGDLVSHLDLYPTVLEALGLPPGRTLGQSLLSGSLPPDRLVPGTLHAFDSPRRWGALTAGGYRLLYSGRSGMQLFDLAKDPAETQDIAKLEPGRVQAMLARAQAMAEATSGTATGLERSDEQMKKALRSLGYVEGSEEH
jgi:arylsulfatase